MVVVIDAVVVVVVVVVATVVVVTVVVESTQPEIRIAAKMETVTNVSGFIRSILFWALKRRI